MQFFMRYEIKRSILQSIALSICLGLSGALFWFAVGEVDEDICRLRTDGGGLYVLDDYGPMCVVTSASMRFCLEPPTTL